VLVIDDSLHQNLLLPNFEGMSLLRTGGGKGASFARNIGMGKSKSNWIAFLDDDDYWLPNHIESLLDFCDRNFLDAAYSSAIVSGRIRPKKAYDGTVSPLQVVYEKANWRKTEYYFPTPGLIISREIAEHLPFNENMLEREDLWFAHKIFEYQFRLRQSEEATVVVNQNTYRSITRTNLKADLDWADRLELIDPIARDNFLMGISFRNAFVRRDWESIREISKKYRSQKLLFQLIAVFTMRS
jgi:glycosyltransferase involved in cell wall biosynthesis